MAPLCMVLSASWFNPRLSFADLANACISLVYVCMYVCMCVYMYICVCVCIMYLCVYVCVCV